MGHDRRLAWLLGVDVATTAVGVVVLLAAHFFVVASGYFLVLAAMVAGAGLVMASGYRPLRAGRADRVVAVLAVANYLIALAATAIAPFAMPILLLATMLPAVLAVPYVSRRQLHGYVVASFTTALGVAALGSLQDVTGFREVLPWWLESGVVIFFIPFMSSMVSIIALTNADCARRERGRAARCRGHDVVASRRSERRRIERDLHDGAQQAIVTAKVQLANLRQEVTRVDATLGSRFDEMRDQLRRASIELRDLAAASTPRRCGKVASVRRCDTPSPPSREMRRWTSARRGASIPKWSEPCTSVSRRLCRTPASTVATGSTSGSSWTATNRNCASPSATTVPDSIRWRPPSARDSTTWSIGSARWVGNSP